MLLQETLKTPFSNNTNDDEKKKNLPAGGTPETHTLREQVVLSRIFKRMVPVDCSYQLKRKKKKERKKKRKEPFVLFVQ